MSEAVEIDPAQAERDRLLGANLRAVAKGKNGIVDIACSRDETRWTVVWGQSVRESRQTHGDTLDAALAAAAKGE